MTDKERQTRYAKILYGGKKSILKISGCEMCPIMKFYINDKVCKCSLFNSPYASKTSIVDSFTINYTDEGIVNDRTFIPAWCGLPNTSGNAKSIPSLYVIHNKEVFINFDNRLDEPNVEVLDVSTLKKNNDKYIIGLLTNMVDLSAKESKPRVFNSNNYNSYQNNTISAHETCSLCGEDDKSVKRNKHFGMCDDCWDYSKDDDSKRSQSFINNFRLKRNKKISNTSFKIINLDYHE